MILTADSIDFAELLSGYIKSSRLNTLHESRISFVILSLEYNKKAKLILVKAHK